MGEHAILSPSGAERWLSCTPSARLETQFPDRAGAAASEGTLAHALGELILRNYLNIISKENFEITLTEIKANHQYEDAMYGYAEDYANFVIEQFNESRATTKDAMIFLEQKLDLTEYVPDGFGTGDAVIIADGTMMITDLKYGKGVMVSADKNKQMMLYALGALRGFDFLYDIQTVRMTIYQPRLNNFSTFEMNADDLRQWGKDFVLPRAKMAFEGTGEFAPGSCCRFCKASAVCKANADYNLQIAKHEFAQPVLLTDEDVSDILTRADHFVSWINSVQEHALTEAVNHGKVWPGHKLVEGRSNRKYSDEAAVANKLLEAGFTEDKLFTKKLLAITAMEKVVGKKDFSIHLDGLIIKPQGAPTLVPESDKRPAYNSAESAKKDFADIQL